MIDVYIIDVNAYILITNTLFLLSANILGMFTSYSSEKNMQNEYIHDQNLRQEKDRSDQLLLNILPKSIVERIHAQNSSLITGLDNYLVDTFAEVTVLFADIVNFTKFSETVSPQEVVKLLNQLFSSFDSICDLQGLEKIKTIGDAYMVVGGLPEYRSDHAQAIAIMSLEMRRVIKEFCTTNDHELNIRIGINSGPVVAGVIGIRKFIYDLWGDTVNTASRMESYSIPGAIQVSESTYNLLKYEFEFESRPPIEIKGKGIMQTYFLIAKL